VELFHKLLKSVISSPDSIGKRNSSVYTVGYCCWWNCPL